MSKKKLLIPVIVFTAIIIVLIIVLNPSHKYNKLSISVSKWNSIKDSRIENENLVLEDIKFNDYKLIIDEKNNTIYYSAVNDSQNKYNPIVSYKANNRNVKLAILSDEITDEKIKSSYDFKVMIFDEKEYHIYNLVFTDLPILNIEYKETVGNMRKSITMEMYLFDNLSNLPNKVIISKGKLRINEDNYTFSLHIISPGKNIRENKISILNMKPSSEYSLTAINKSENEEQGSNVDNESHRIELFLNNEYKGVYSLTLGAERIKKGSDEIKPKN